jgi:hypothetical protein
MYKQKCKQKYRLCTETWTELFIYITIYELSAVVRLNVSYTESLAAYGNFLFVCLYVCMSI